MGNLLNVITSLHKKTMRDYVGRMMNKKVECMRIARRYDYDFWDGDRCYGYGGYHYDRRWEIVARKLIEYYKLGKHARILDVGCGKGHLLFEFKKLLPSCEICGFDISQYAIEHAKEEIKGNLFVHRAEKSYPLKDKEFDLVVSLNTLHNLLIYDLKKALTEIERVGKQKYIVVEGYRNESELFGLQCWALTAEDFFRPEEWRWLFKEFNYTGDYEFIYFE